jgi:hypothetical protein
MHSVPTGRKKVGEEGADKHRMNEPARPEDRCILMVAVYGILASTRGTAVVEHELWGSWMVRAATRHTPWEGGRTDFGLGYATSCEHTFESLRIPRHYNRSSSGQSSCCKQTS